MERGSREKERSPSATNSVSEVTDVDTGEDISYDSGGEESHFFASTTGGHGRRRGLSDAIPLSLPERKHRQKWSRRLVCCFLFPVSDSWFGIDSICVDRTNV